MKQLLKLRVNGEDHEAYADPRRNLAEVLRDELGLTGTKYGCGIGICGACDVHLDGVATRSCITMLSAVVGRDIRTIEGLAGGESLHPVQQAFLDEQAAQCGWCTSGQIMRAAAFLESNPKPTEDEILSAMNNNLCRCGAYGRIKRAVVKAADGMAGAGGDHG